MVGAAAVMSRTSPSLTRTTQGPPTAGLQTRPTSVARAASIGSGSVVQSASFIPLPRSGTCCAFHLPDMFDAGKPAQGLTAGGLARL